MSGPGGCSSRRLRCSPACAGAALWRGRGSQSGTCSTLQYPLQYTLQYQGGARRSGTQSSVTVPARGTELHTQLTCRQNITHSREGRLPRHCRPRPRTEAAAARPASPAASPSPCSRSDGCSRLQPSNIYQSVAFMIVVTCSYYITNICLAGTLTAECALYEGETRREEADQAGEVRGGGARPHRHQSAEHLPVLTHLCVGAPVDRIVLPAAGQDAAGESQDQLQQHQPAV